MALKRSRDKYDTESTIAMANYLLMLSQGLKTTNTTVSSNEGCIFECKTCNRKFSSFQALGGHRASHKRPRPTNVDRCHDHDDHTTEEGKAGKPKIHKCSICGLAFSIGQALGGHMRRHRAALGGSMRSTRPLLSLNLSSSPLSDLSIGLTRDSGSLLSMDLNLTPRENGLLEMKNVAPIFA